jgi:dienelactone hydrolase
MMKLAPIGLAGLSSLSLSIIMGIMGMGDAWAKDSKRTVTFPSGDGLEISADLYLAHEDPKTPFIVLFHQAGFSRGEYQEIAPRLNAMGFNCMAVDLRSGGTVKKVANQTHARAEKAKLGTSYIDALPDMRAALEYAREHHAKGKLIAWGSSYSSALVLRLAGERPELMDIAMAFAPGEYFAKLGQSKNYVREAAAKIDMPVFITSAKHEKKSWQAIFAAIPSKHKVSYLPAKSAGNHGSRALWREFDDHEGYWRAVSAFLDQYAQR